MTGELVYAAAVAWALFGILVANRVQDRDAVVGGTADSLLPLELAAALVAG